MISEYDDLFLKKIHNNVETGDTACSVSLFCTTMQMSCHVYEGTGHSEMCCCARDLM